LVRRPTGVSFHCPSGTCLMNTDHHLHRVLLGKQKKLCPECTAELAQSSKQSPPSNLRFAAAVLVRSEVDYHVLSVPNRLTLVVGELTDQLCQDFRARVHAETPGASGSTSVYCLARNEVLDDPVKVSQIINRFQNDPFDLVRKNGPKTLLRACVDRYYAIGQYSNVIAALHQAILLDSKDDWSYNRLAWIKATCPDGSVRNGKEAVSVATKACELTEWKDWEFIDTLAAAYAEAGDFKRAIEFQGQALRTGNPSESEQNEMRERLSLYGESRPFHDKPDKP